MNAVRLWPAVAFKVYAQLAAWTLDGAINGSLRREETFCPQLEVMDQGFHTRADLRTRRRDKFTVVAKDGTHRQLIQCLFHDLQGFTQLLYTHDITRIRIAFGFNGHVEVILFVSRIRTDLS